MYDVWSEMLQFLKDWWTFIQIHQYGFKKYHFWEVILAQWMRPKLLYPIYKFDYADNIRIIWS